MWKVTTTLNGEVIDTRTISATTDFDAVQAVTQELVVEGLLSPHTKYAASYTAEVTHHEPK